MEFADVVRKRRMVRNYLPTAVEPDVLARIVAVGNRAPSAGHTQGQSFVVVTDPRLRVRIASLGGEAEYVAQGFDPWISGAPAHIVVCVSEPLYHDRYQQPDKLDGSGSEIAWPVPYWWVDAGASMMAILLAAVDEGLAGGFLGVHSITGLREVLGIPEHVSPIGVVTVGHPAPDRRSSSLDRGRRPKTVHWQQWDDSLPTEHST